MVPALHLHSSPPLYIPPWMTIDASPSPPTTAATLRLVLPSPLDSAADEFLMYEFKVRRCPRVRAHDWTECPYAHAGEKARRRDPRQFCYAAEQCRDFRQGAPGCRRGDACDLAHGVFEMWLHPARYRTQPCNAGSGCRRRVCFFAHSPEELRLVSPPPAGKWGEEVTVSPRSILSTPPRSPESEISPPTIERVVVAMKILRLCRQKLVPVCGALRGVEGSASAMTATATRRREVAAAVAGPESEEEMTLASDFAWVSELVN